MGKGKLVCLGLLLPFALSLSTNVLADDALTLFRRGDGAGADAASRVEVENARSTGDKVGLWTALMKNAWLWDEMGRSRDSISLSNEALGIAADLNDSFLLGRSLCWLGWAHASIGLYSAAEQFYQHAIDIGAPNGVVQAPMVWGLATQELGALYFKMGDARRAKELLEETTTFARKHGVSVGIAEGAAHLAELALHEGRVVDAFALSEEAQRASMGFACSMYNVARAKMIGAKVAQRRFEQGEISREQALARVDDAIRFADSKGITIALAQSKIIKSHLLEPSRQEERYALLLAAVELLEGSGSEHRGSALGEVGAVLLEQDTIEHAEFYLKKGLKINQKMLREVDKSRMLGSVAQLEGLRGDDQARISALKRSADAALNTGEQEAVFKTSLELAEAFDQLGYGSLAVRWYGVFLDAAERLINQEKRPAMLEQLQARRLTVLQRSSGLAAALAIPTSGAPVS